MHALYKRLSTLQGELEDLGEEVEGEVGEALSDASESVEDALDRLDDLKDVAVEIVVDGKAAESIEKLTDLLKKLAREEEEYVRRLQ